MTNISRTLDHSSLDEMVFYLDSECETEQDLRDAAWHAVSRELKKSEQTKEINELVTMFKCSNCKNAELKSKIRDRIEECRTRNMPLLPQLYLALMITSFDNVSVMLAAFSEHDGIAPKFCASETIEKNIFKDIAFFTIIDWFQRFVRTLYNLRFLSQGVIGLYFKIPLKPDELLIEAIETIEDTKIRGKVKRFFNIQEEIAA